MARNSPGDSHWGGVPDRDHFLVGLHGSAIVARIGSLSLAYAPEVLPVFVVTKNPKYRRVAGNWYQVTGEGPVYGVGISPLGLEGRWQLAPNTVVVATGTVGALRFTRNVPAPDARAFNYMFDYGAAIQVTARRHTIIRAGYRFHHFSNLYRAPTNPGVVGNVFYLGVGQTPG